MVDPVVVDVSETVEKAAMPSKPNAAKTPYIYGFFVRGFPPEWGQSPGWQIELATLGDDGKEYPMSTALNMSQAADLGYSLPTILAALNTTNLTRIEGLKRSRDKAVLVVDSLLDRIRIAETELAGVQAALTETQQKLADAEASLSQAQQSQVGGTP